MALKGEPSQGWYQNTKRSLVMRVHKELFRWTAVSEATPMTAPDQSVLQAKISTVGCFTSDFALWKDDGIWFPFFFLFILFCFLILIILRIMESLIVVVRALSSMIHIFLLLLFWKQIIPVIYIFFFLLSKSASQYLLETQILLFMFYLFTSTSRQTGVILSAFLPP